MAVITSNTGTPGGGVSVRLRGTSSIVGGAEPLFIVDGVIVDTEGGESVQPTDVTRVILFKRNLEKVCRDRDELVDQIFDFMVRDFSRYALDLHSTNSTTPRFAMLNSPSKLKARGSESEPYSAILR